MERNRPIVTIVVEKSAAVTDFNRRSEENDDDEEETFYGWEFQTATGDRYINIEKWAGDAQFYVYATYTLDPDTIEVFDGGKPA